MGILAVMSFIVRISDAVIGSEGVLVLVDGLDEGSAFELARRPQLMERYEEDEVGVMGGDNRLERGSIWDVCDDEIAPLTAHETFVPSGDVEGKAGALGVGVW